MTCPRTPITQALFVSLVLVLLVVGLTACGSSGATRPSASGPGYQFNCIPNVGGTVHCAGSNNYGQLGNGTTANSSTPVQVTGVTNAGLVAAAGDGFACQSLAAGAVKCWGNNASGQLGDGSTTNVGNPRRRDQKTRARGPVRCPSLSSPCEAS
jgi:alpha-tubulin suppressor-like RCC1 family protein